MSKRVPLLGASRPLIPGPYDTRNAADMLNLEWAPLQKEIAASDVSEDIKKYARVLNDEWEKFYYDIHNSFFYAGLYSSYSMVMSFQEKMKLLREKFIADGGATSTSRKPFEEVPLFEGPKPVKLGFFGWSVVGGAALFLLYKLTEARSRLVGAQSGLVRAKTGQPKSHKKGRY